MDWDWQMPVIYLPFFFFAGGLLKYGVISRTLANEESKSSLSAGRPSRVPVPSTAGGKRLFLKLRGWKVALGIGCVIAMTLTVFHMLSKTRVEKDGELVQAANQFMSQNNYNSAESKYLELEASARWAHKFNPLDEQPLKDEAVANEGQGIYLRNLNKAEEAQQKFDRARDLWYQALEKEPYNYRIYVDLGRYYLETNQIDKAVEVTKKARELNPYESKIIGNLEVEVRKQGGILGY
jgi:tetratricopeptide (TPR) repeat protein